MNITLESANGLKDVQFVGENPRKSPEVREIYRQLRDFRSSARLIERESEISERAIRPLLSAHKEWAEVRQLANVILFNYSKDVEVAAWLIEAQTRLDGFQGLAHAIRLVDDMVAAFGNALHPQPEDADDDTFAALAGLNGSGRPGVLLQPLRLLSLTPGAPYGEMTLWDVQNGGAEDTVRDAMHQSGSAQMQMHLEHIEDAAQAIRDLDVRLSTLRGTDAPSFVQVSDIIDDSARTVRRLAALEERLETVEVDQSERVASTASRAGAINSREDAFNQLIEVSAYFRKAEPHSPIADALETLVRRGRMDFVTLLKELVPDDHARAAVLTTAGINISDTGDETN